LLFLGLFSVALFPGNFSADALAPDMLESQVTHQGLMTRNQRWKKDIQISCAKKDHIWDGQKRGETDPAADDRREQVLQEEFIIRFKKGQRRV